MLLPTQSGEVHHVAPIVYHHAVLKPSIREVHKAFEAILASLGKHKSNALENELDVLARQLNLPLKD